MRTGEIRKYLLYAIGELILVVVGILVALQINNRNDIRKQELRIKQIKQSVRTELIRNQEELRSDITDMEFVRAACDNVLDLMSNPEAVDTVDVDLILGKTMGYATWNATTYAMDELINMGLLSVLDDDSVVHLIHAYKAAVQDGQEHVGFLDIQSRALMDYVAEHGNVRRSTAANPYLNLGASKMVGNEVLLKDRGFENRLGMKVISCTFILEKYRSIETIMERLINQLEETGN